MKALVLAALLASSCTTPPPDGALPCGPNRAHPCPAGYGCTDGRCFVTGHVFDDMSVAIAAEDLAPPSPPDLLELADLAPGPAADLSPLTCGAAAGQPCCPATPEEAATLPSPPGGVQKGVGRCMPGLACASASCPAHTTCADGSYNGSPATVYVTYCVPL
jgi:hypothetical protein